VVQAEAELEIQLAALLQLEQQTLAVEAEVAIHTQVVMVHLAAQE
jgi:hypothetical protein